MCEGKSMFLVTMNENLPPLSFTLISGIKDGLEETSEW